MMPTLSPPPPSSSSSSSSSSPSSPTGAASLGRYARQMVLPSIGAAGQQKLQQASVLVVGLGGLGCPAATYLAAAGVGHLALVDPDQIAWSNLHRQVLYREADVGRFKAEEAQARLHAHNKDIRITSHTEAVCADNALEWATAYDVVLDATDNFNSRYALCDASALAKKPYVYGSVLGFMGQVSLFAPHQGGPCYRCIYPAPPAKGMAPSCAEAGVLGVLPGIIGSMQALEALKWILGLPGGLSHTLCVLDGLGAGFRKLATRADPACALCGPKASITKVVQETQAYAPLAVVPSIDAGALRQQLAATSLRPALLDVRDPNEWAMLAPLPDAHCISLPDLEQRAAELPRNKNLVVYCASGRRSRAAVAKLQALGFEQVWDLAHGLEGFMVG